MPAGPPGLGPESAAHLQGRQYLWCRLAPRPARKGHRGPGTWGVPRNECPTAYDRVGSSEPASASGELYATLALSCRLLNSHHRCRRLRRSGGRLGWRRPIAVLRWRRRPDASIRRAAYRRQGGGLTAFASAARHRRATRRALERVRRDRSAVASGRRPDQRGDGADPCDAVTRRASVLVVPVTSPEQKRVVA